MDNYRKIEIVGKGSFGYAVLVQNQQNRKYYIMKIIDVSRMEKKQKEDALNEVKLLKALTHPFIIQYRESFMDKNRYLCIVMDYADKGDLHKKIQEQRKTGKHFTEDQILNYFVQICYGLKYVHGKKILHRDLKTQNIFLTSKDEVKIGDFGIARVLQNTCDCAQTAIGTPYYLSPEICQEKPYNQKSDIWSLGCILYEMMTLRHAFDSSNMKGLVLKILRGNFPPLPQIYSQDLRDLVAEMLTKDPENRPSIKRILNKEFLSGRVNILLSRMANSLQSSTQSTQSQQYSDQMSDSNHSSSYNNNNNNSLSQNNNNIQQQYKQQQQQQEEMGIKQQQQSIQMFKQIDQSKNNVNNIKQQQQQQQSNKSILNQEKVQRILRSNSQYSNNNSQNQNYNSNQSILQQQKQTFNNIMKRQRSIEQKQQMSMQNKSKIQQLDQENQQILSNLNNNNSENVNYSKNNNMNQNNGKLKYNFGQNILQQQQQQQNSQKQILKPLNLQQQQQQLQIQSKSNGNIRSQSPYLSNINNSNKNNIKVNSNHVLKSNKVNLRMNSRSKSRDGKQQNSVNNFKIKRQTSRTQLKTDQSVIEDQQSQQQQKQQTQQSEEDFQEPEDQRVRSKFLTIEGQSLPGVNSEKDSIFLRIEALKMYLEKQLGEEQFMTCYQQLSNGEDKQFKISKYLGKEKQKFVPLIYQLLVCEDSYYVN